MEVSLSLMNVMETQPPGVDRFQLRKPMPRSKFEPLAKEIFALKKQLNAVILAHNYQVPEIQDVADFVGDSLGLSQQAAKTDADVIVFCGVHFMAETAKILNPNKIVVLPDKDAGCSLEESCPADQLAALQKTNPNFWTVTYINCSAAVKALSDVICTSGNAVKIVEAAPKDKDLLFVPDENLGAWVMEQTGRPMTLWKGNCYAHVEFRARSGAAIARAISRRQGGGPSRKLARSARSGRRGLLDGKDDYVLQERSGEAVRHRDRVGHHSPDAEGMSGQGISVRAGV